MASHGHGHHETHSVQPLPKDSAKIRRIWTVCGILAFITALEFAATFLLPRGWVLIAFFVLLTFVKTFYIVGEFMHLKYEVKMLIWSVILPMLFVIWLITAMIVEGGSVLNLRSWFS